MGKTKSDFEMFEKSLYSIAKEELNLFFASDNGNPENKDEVLEEHLRNNILIEELYQSFNDKKVEPQRFTRLCKDQISSAKKRAKALKFGYPNSSLPEHKGFNKLIRILEENEEYPQILELCIQAKEQGWKGHWDDEIKRIKVLMKHRVRE